MRSCNWRLASVNSERNYKAAASSERKDKKGLQNFSFFSPYDIWDLIPALARSRIIPLQTMISSDDDLLDIAHAGTTGERSMPHLHHHTSSLSTNPPSQQGQGGNGNGTSGGNSAPTNVNEGGVGPEDIQGESNSQRFLSAICYATEAPPFKLLCELG